LIQENDTEMKLTKITLTVRKVEHLGNEGTFESRDEQSYQASSSYKGAGVIKRKQSDGKRERTQSTLDKIESRFEYLLRSEANLANLKFCRNERRERRKAERRAKRK
jgi:hypothetical protein